MSLTIAPAAQSVFVTKREIDASAVEAYRTATAKLATLNPTSNNTFVRRARETQALIAQGSLDALGGRSSAMGADLVREARLVREIEAAKASGADYSARARSLGQVRGRIFRKLTARSN